MIRTQPWKSWRCWLLWTIAIGLSPTICLLLHLEQPWPWVTGFVVGGSFAVLGIYWQEAVDRLNDCPFPEFRDEPWDELSIVERWADLEERAQTNDKEPSC